MRTLALAAFAASALLAGSAVAAPCKDAKGRFTKCPTPAAAKASARCKDDKGKFAKCGSPGAKPM